MKKAVILDRINRKNLGARTTCKALVNILEEARITIIGTFDNDLANSIDRNLDFEDLADEIEKLQSADVVTILKLLEEADYFILNGEGSMIFSIPPRKELSFHYAMTKLAKKRKCKTFYVNSIASPGMFTDVDIKKVEETKRFSKYCDELIVRDYYSYEFLLKYIDKVKYIPEVLFDFANKYRYLSHMRIPSGDIFLTFPEDTFSLGKVIVKEPYILISGSSAFSRIKFDENVKQKYVELVSKLKSSGCNVILVKTCGSEKYLNIVGKETNAPVIECDNNFLLLYWIIVRANVFISGRFHPSILASAGGVPCILLSSSSHKSSAYYSYFKCYSKKNEIVSATLQHSDDVEKIIKRCIELKKNKILRFLIKKDSRRNGKKARKEYLKLFAENE